MLKVLLRVLSQVASNLALKMKGSKAVEVDAEIRDRVRFTVIWVWWLRGCGNGLWTAQKEGKW